MSQISTFKDHVKKLFFKIQNKIGPQKWKLFMEKVLLDSQNHKSIQIFKLCEILNSVKIELSERSRLKILSAYGTKHNFVDISFMYEVEEV